MKRKMTDKVTLVGEGIKTLSYATLARGIEQWEDKVYVLDNKLVDFFEDGSASSQIKDTNIKRYIAALNSKIEETKKRMKCIQIYCI